MIESSRQLQLTASVTQMAKLLIPDHMSVDSIWTMGARELLSAFLLCHVDCVYAPSSLCILLQEIECATSLKEWIASLLKNSFSVNFSVPDVLQSGCFYLIFDPEKHAFLYAAKEDGELYQGEISDEKYNPLKEKFKKTGKLSLKEVNFLIAKEVMTKENWSVNKKVIDPFCRDYFEKLLTCDPRMQANFIQLLMASIKPYGDASIRDPLSRISVFNDVPSISLRQLSELISNHDAEISYFEWSQQEEERMKKMNESVHA